MGLAASQARCIMLTGRINDLGFQQQQLCQQRQMLAMRTGAIGMQLTSLMQADANSQRSGGGNMGSSIGGMLGMVAGAYFGGAMGASMGASIGSSLGGSLAGGGSNCNPNAAQEAELNGQLLMAQQQDKVLEMQGQQLDTQVKAAQTELEAVHKQLEYATGEKSSFSFCAPKG